MKPVIIVLIVLILLSLLIIFFLLKNKDKKPPLKYPFLTEVLKKSQIQQLYGDSIRKINLLEINNLREKCKEITGKDNICYKNLDYLSVGFDEMNKLDINIKYMTAKAILASLKNPEVAVGLVYFSALVLGHGNNFKIFYDKDGNIDYVNQYGLENSEYVLATNKKIVKKLLEIEPNTNVDVNALEITKPYYDSVKNRYNNGDFNDNTSNLTLKFLIDVIMADISLGYSINMSSYTCDI